MMTITFSLASSLIIGAGATLFMDISALIQRYGWGICALDYALVGRWIGHMRHGQFIHQAIHQAPAVRGERALGWLLHYLIGMAFAVLLVAGCGAGWLLHPTLLPALLVGGFSVLAPMLVMQPAFGLGLAAARSAQPMQARLRSLLAHLTFGAGLYLAAIAWRSLVSGYYGV